MTCGMNSLYQLKSVFAHGVRFSVGDAITIYTWCLSIYILHLTPILYSIILEDEHTIKAYTLVPHLGCVC